MIRISFALTTPQFRARTKFVTRRFGKRNYTPGQRLAGVEKAMGFRKGERAPAPMGVIEVAEARWEPVDAVTDEDVVLEGFPDKDAAWFVDMLCKHSGRRPSDPVQRVEFGYVLPDGNVLWRPGRVAG